ncbi:follicle cell protein 3C-1 [Drosophila ficusphila]|uniref:follicle cell protein 3C-1 n=1 Tax=Drosophila ficusphila TaxID=30025 RepID=UPI0007E7FFA6|nr:follicle cell protein 3C-1 [Drosophila ficusphila]
MAAFRNSLLLVTLLLALHLEASKIVYKKPLYGNSNSLKEKRTRTKSAKPESLPTTTAAGEDCPSAVEFVIVTTPRGDVEISSEAANNGTSTAEPAVEDAAAILAAGSSKSGELSTVPVSVSTSFSETSTTASSLASTLPSPPTPESSSAAPQPDNQPVPCTCGVFLSSQIPNGLPTKPLIHQELDRMFPCNAIGRKQCQTKCLEAIVQHLPNSANIVCAALGHDCHKERAYLFIKNCHNQWVNTNLQAGREYCCRGGVPYRCPLLG